MSTVLADRAPAKVNLTLAVRGRRPDGYHELESLVVFAGAGDALRFESGGPGYRLIVRGRTAAAAGPVPDNLILRAARLLAERVPGLPGGAFTLVKRLPVAAGLGGGSSDAASALRLLARAGGLPAGDPRPMEAARLLGADVPGCLDAKSRMMRGTGHDLGPVLALPRLPALLVNPGVAVPTPDVFRTLGMMPGDRGEADPLGMLDGGEGLAGEGLAGEGLAGAMPRGAMIERLAGSRNDLEPPAIAIAPGVADALGCLRATAGCRLARMSGSGATVFGLFDTCRAAAAAGKAIQARQPDWWVKPTMLG